MSWRYLSDDGAGAADGLALDEALAASHGRHRAAPPTTLRLYTYRSHVALCGRFQHLEAEIDIEACRRTGTPFNRRPTGGGAIVMGAGQLGVAVTTAAPVAERPRAILLRFSQGVVAGLAKLGIEARFGGKNDLKVDGRKVAGLGLFLDDSGGLLFHASVLADLDIPLMLDVLDIPAAKLGLKAASAVAERVTTVSGETGVPWSGAELRDVIAHGFAEAMDVRLIPGEVTPDEVERARSLVDTKYRLDEWLYQRSPQADATATTTFKTPGGLVRVYLALQGTTIKSALFTGDFNQIPDPLAQFEGDLKWSRLDRHGLLGLAARSFPDGTGLGVDPEVLVDAVLEAGARAITREEAVAAPALSGSCYFPDNPGDSDDNRP